MKQRLTKLLHEMEEEAIDALLVTNKINRRYLCGFTGSNGLLVVTAKRSTLIIDGRYTEQAAQQTNGMAIYTLGQKESSFFAAAKVLVGSKRVGIEKEYMTYGEYELLVTALKGTSTDIVPTDNLVERLRMIKTASELANVRQAANLADRTFDYLLTKIQPGMTELELANEMDYFSKKIGSEGPAFETIVASGIRTALPHAHASSKTIEKNELIMVDFGCIVNGYYSDITRTFALGEVSQQIKDSYQLLLHVQKCAISGITLGTQLAAIDQAARNLLAKHEQAQYFVHGLGHGIGLSCHEYPYLNPSGQEALQAEMAFTVEPGIYYEGNYGIRIEDDVVVHDNGEIEVLTKSTKEWMNVSWN